MNIFKNKNPKTTFIAIVNIVLFGIGIGMLSIERITLTEFTSYLVVITSVMTSLMGLYSKDKDDKEEDI